MRWLNLVCILGLTGIAFGVSCRTGETVCDKGCCPLTGAVCCSDGSSCCPAGTMCDLKRGLCLVQGRFPVFRLYRQRVPKPDSSFPVPGRTFPQANVTCTESQTACSWTASSSQCCPVPEAVCCKDKLHCCPKGYICDDQPQICRYPDTDKAPIKAPVPQKVAKTAIFEKVGRVSCDATSSCPADNTCCILPSGQWGCCPQPEAVCCSDRIHCCPHDYRCELSTGTCVVGSTSIPLLKKTTALKHVKTPALKHVKTPALSRPQSGSGNTCCRLRSGAWGCCPAINAVCCPDKEHCCPNGYQCTSSGSCTKPGSEILGLKKNPSIEIGRADNGLVRCDSTHYCPSGNTCCLLKSGAWGCCPAINAVCCPDKEHCCPNGYQCTSSGSCTKPGSEILGLKKNPSIEIGRADNGLGNTCCQLRSGAWGCCPAINAVCCPDKEHCCPNGYQCTSSGSCTKPGSEILGLKKKPALKMGGGDPVMCDATHECPESNTCCRLKSGKWGCCPRPEAVCCSDGEHCCPNGYKCSSTGTCTNNFSEIPAFKKKPATQVEAKLVQCDSTHYCPSGNTCCRLKSGAWGCCPVANAVCCPDKEHCCPNGYQCTSSGSCIKHGSEILGLKKSPSIEIAGGDPVKCDATHECPQYNTCCQNRTGAWYCCDELDGVCCPERQSCCPPGFYCGTGGCNLSRHANVLKMISNKYRKKRK